MPVYSNSASVALQALRTINSQLDTTTQRISTGYRVNSAKDDATYWSVSVKANNDIRGLEAVKNSLGYADGYLGVASSGIEQARTKLQQARDVLVTANNGGADFTLIDSQMRGLVDDAIAAVKGANYNGTNLLTLNSATTTSVAFVVALDGTSTPATLSLATAGLTMENGTTAGVLNPVSDDYKTGGAGAAITTAALANTAIGLIDTAISNMLTAEGKIGAAQSRIVSQRSFNQALIDAKTNAVTALIGADLEGESTRLQALQTKQQLALQALGIANNQSASILALFR